MHSIPPGVVGERQGQLTLVVDEIIWLVEVDTPGRVRAEWWGSKTGQQADFCPVDVRNFTMCVAGGSMVHCYPVFTGRDKLAQYFSDASSLVLALSDGKARARVPLSIDGVDGYFPLLDSGGEEVAHIHVKITYRDSAEEEETNSEEAVKETRPAGRKPLLKTQRLGRYQRSKSSSSSLSPPGKENSPRKKKQKPNRVTFSSNTPESAGSQPSYKAPIADSLITSLLNESSNLRETMKHQLELAQLDLDSYSDDDNTENIDPSLSYSEPTRPQDIARPSKPPVKSLSVFLTVNLLSVQLEEFILEKLKTTPKPRPSFVPASKSRSARNPESTNSSLAVIVKCSFPDKKETSFCSRKFNKNTAEFNETALEPVVIDETWWDQHINLTVHCRVFGQKDTILLGSASIGCKHLLSDSACVLQSQPVTLNIYASQSLYRQLQQRPGECRELVGHVSVSFKITSADAGKVQKAKSPPAAAVKERRPRSSSQARPRSPVTLESRARQPSVCLVPAEPVLVRLSLTAAPGLSLKVRWWTGRLVEAGSCLQATETLLVAGKEARMVNRQTVSSLRSNYLVVEVWRAGALLGISRLPTQSLAQAASDWAGAVVSCEAGELEIVSFTDGQILGSLTASLTVGYRHQLDLVSHKQTMTPREEEEEEKEGEEKEGCENRRVEVASLAMTQTATQATSPEQRQKEAVTSQELTETVDDPLPDTGRTVDSVSQVSVTSTTSSGKGEGKFLAEISVEEGRVDRRGEAGGVYCSLPGGERSPVRTSSRPVWALTVETEVNIQFLLDCQHQLVIRVWLASSDCPDTVSDSMLGFAAVDLTPLLSFPVLSGWYNIINWAGKCRGQLKVTVKPLEPLMRNNNILNTNSSSPRSRSSPELTSLALPQSCQPEVRQESSGASRPEETQAETERSHYWSLPQTNFLQDHQASLSFLESSLARNLQDLESLTTKLVGEQEDKTEENPLESCREPSEPVFVENLESVSLSMLQTRISSHLSSLQLMARQGQEEQRFRVERQELPSLPTLSDDDKSEELDSERSRSRIGPEGGNTES